MGAWSCISYVVVFPDAFAAVFDKRCRYRCCCRQVRGAPLIAIVAALGLAVECSGATQNGTAQEASSMLHEK